MTCSEDIACVAFSQSVQSLTGTMIREICVYKKSWSNIIDLMLCLLKLTTMQGIITYAQCNIIYCEFSTHRCICLGNHQFGERLWKRSELLDMARADLLTNDPGLDDDDDSACFH